MKVSLPLSSLAVALVLVCHATGAEEAEAEAEPAAAPTAAAEVLPPACACPAKPRLGPLPTMFGDFLQPVPALPLMRFVDIGGLIGDLPVALAPLKVAENESPRPQSRVYVHYSYFADVAGPVNDLNREIFGVEWAWNDHFSVGARVPYVQQSWSIYDDTLVGDLSVIFKWAPINETDRVCAVGMDLTVPSGDSPYWFADGGDLHPVWFQFFAGYYRGWGDCFLHGFTSLAVPSDSRETTILFQDLGLGYWLRCSRRCLRAVVPTFEAHLNVPLDQPNLSTVLRYRTSMNLTLGATAFFTERCSLGAAAATPITGPRPFGTEGIVSFNWRF
jgi:hypothetical protein